MNGAVTSSALLAPPGQAVRMPVAYIVTALPAPVGNTPALLSMGCVWDFHPSLVPQEVCRSRNGPHACQCWQ